MLTGEEIGWAPELKKIYDFEADRVSGSSSYLRDFKKVIWSRDELDEALKPTHDEAQLIDKLLETMDAKNELLKVPCRDGMTRYITRTAETIRLLGHNYEYWFRGRPGVGAVRWVVEEKRIPKRVTTAEEFIDEVRDIIFSEIGNGPQTYNIVKASGIVIQATAKNIKGKDWKKVRFSRFQVDSTKDILLSEFKPGYKKKAQVLTAGVGSGKTYAFSTGVLIAALESILSGDTDKKRIYLLAYPRVALAQDQFNTLRRVADLTGYEGLVVHLEHSSYYSNAKDGSKKLFPSVAAGIEHFYGRNASPPSIIVTTLETLKRRLQNQYFIRSVGAHLRRVVLDEVHLVQGLSGAHIILLLRRLREACRPNDILWAAASATIACPDDHASVLFDVKKSEVSLIEATSNELDVVGIAHHVFLRSTGFISNLGTLVNSTSILVHNRRESISERGSSSKTLQKTICFADNLDLLGRWNADLRENERTEYSYERRHPDQPDVKTWDAYQREVPYALRFHEPLATRIAAEGGLEERYEAVLKDLRAETSICEKCKTKQRVGLRACTAEEMKELGRLVNRRPHFHDADRIKRFNIYHPIFNSAAEIDILDDCPYLRAGACFRFSKDDEQSEQIPFTKNYEWRSVARSKIYSAKTKSESGLEDDLSDIVFNAPVKDVYDIGKDDIKGQIPIDIVLASPTLEVGVDLANVNESIMFKAIRNVASYRQKAGRVGREEGSDSLNVILVSGRPIDLHYYRQPRKLVSTAQLDPIPLEAHNDAILRCGLYLAVIDHLALFAGLPDYITKTGINRDETDFTRQLIHVVDYLTTRRTSIKDYVSRISLGLYPPDSMVIEDAIVQVEFELGLLLRPFPLAGHQWKLSDVMVNLLCEHGSRIIPPDSKHKTELESKIGAYTNLRRTLDAKALGIDEEFHRLDVLLEKRWTGKEALEAAAEIIRDGVDEVERNDSAGQLKKQIRNAKAILLTCIEPIIEEIEEMAKEGEDPVARMFFDWFNNYRNVGKDSQWKAHYLSYVLQDAEFFEVFRRDPSFIRPPNLFSDPYEFMVELQPDKGDSSTVTVGEALFGFIPGTWTYRQGKNAFKVKCGSLTPSRGGELTATLDQLRRAGNEFLGIAENIPAPPDLPSRTITIYRPARLALSKCDKHVDLNSITSTVLDNDEDNSRARRIPVKVPQSYLGRWVHVQPSDCTKIGCCDFEKERFVIDSEESGAVEGTKAHELVQHPMLEYLLDSVNWHDSLEVYDYVYSVTRNYTSKVSNSADLFFVDGNGQMGMGKKLLTEGLSILLNPKCVIASMERMKAGFIGQEGRWGPSAIKAFNAALSRIQLEDGTRLSPHSIRDIISLLIYSQLSKPPEGLPFKLAEHLSNLADDEVALNKMTEEFYRSRLKKTIDPILMYSDVNPDETAEIESMKSRLVDSIRTIKGKVPFLDQYMGDWLAQTLLNTFGIVALGALQKLSGSNEGAVGYTIDLDGIGNGVFRIYLYDRNQHGNGSCDVVRRYLHILNIQRYGEDRAARLLPSEDFLSILEQGLLQCPQHHTDMDALYKYEQWLAKKAPEGLPELEYVRDASDEVLETSKAVWSSLGITGLKDAWKLTILGLSPDAIALRTNQSSDDVQRATSICWNGCPECVINRDAMIGASAELFLDKAVLDEWFKVGREGTKEYLSLKVDELAKGKVDVGIGQKSRLLIKLDNRNIRSISLPFTIGFELDRSGDAKGTRLIIRNDDIAALRYFKDVDESTTRGIKSFGFKRILWYDLIMAGYLDSLGLIEASRKRILLVYYDCRDVRFDDVGISPRMLDALDYQRKKAKHFGDLENLSDMLGWLSRCGFDITLCVDNKQSKSDFDIKNFLKRMSSNSGVRIATMDLEGRMHVKAMISPLGCIDGSANLTESGAKWNEENISYASLRSQGYKDMRLAIEDIMDHVQPWKGD